ncbi:unnamed protein product [Knipowitschia caucasica]|uniref:Leucine-rich repeat-containing protein 59 n=1 Tax=Knipowitschia caucasica TaxID=637954 RepID=A0AAV2LB55_KNICA
MSKNKLLNIKDKIEGNEADLSLWNLTEVPVRELAAVSKVTVVDLSCNNITVITPEFCGLVHLVKLDLNKNQLECLPEEFGHLVHLQHLDLLGNRLKDLPVSFCRLRSLRWLDLKDNPLEPGLAKAAGDCLDERQCKQCASQVLQHMRGLHEEVEKIRQKKLQREKELEKKREAKQREREAREKEQKKREKAEEKERRRHEYNQQVAAQAAQEQSRRRQEEKRRRSGKSTEKLSVAAAPLTPARRSVLRLLLRLFLVVSLGLVAAVVSCRFTELSLQSVCSDLNLLLDQSLSWTRDQRVLIQDLIQDLILDLSASARRLIEATHQQFTANN